MRVCSDKMQAQRGWWKHCGSVEGVETTNDLGSKGSKGK